MKLVTGTYCIPCKMLHTWMEEHGIKVEELDSQKDFDEIKELGVKQTPTLILDNNTLVTGIEDIKNYFIKGVN